MCPKSRRRLRGEGATLRGITAALNRRSYQTRRGTPWRLESVARVLKRFAERAVSPRWPVAERCNLGTVGWHYQLVVLQDKMSPKDAMRLKETYKYIHDCLSGVGLGDCIEPYAHVAAIDVLHLQYRPKIVRFLI